MPTHATGEDTLNAAGTAVSSLTISNAGTYTPDPSAVYIVRLAAEKAGGSAVPSSLAGWGGTWQQVTTIASGNFRITSFWGVPSSSTPGNLTGTWAATQDNCTIQVQKWGGADLLDPIGLTDTSLVASGTSITHSLAGIAPGSAVSMGNLLNGTSGGFTPGAGMTLSGTGINMGSYRHDEFYAETGQAAPSVSWVNTRMAIGDAIEILAATSPPSTGVALLRRRREG
jgi:hypothetical protein